MLSQILTGGSATGNQTGHNVPLDGNGGVATDKIIFISWSIDPGTLTLGAGWTERIRVVGTARLSIITKPNTTDTTCTITSQNNTGSEYVSALSSGNVALMSISAGTSGGSQNPDHAGISGLASGTYTFVHAMASRPSNRQISAYPANFTQSRTTSPSGSGVGGADPRISICAIELIGTGADPDAWNLTAAADWAEATVAIPPHLQATFGSATEADTAQPFTATTRLTAEFSFAVHVNEAEDFETIAVSANIAQFSRANTQTTAFSFETSVRQTADFPPVSDTAIAGGFTATTPASDPEGKRGAGIWSNLWWIHNRKK